MQRYDHSYFKANGQATDRPALRWFVRVARRHLDLDRTCDFGCGVGWLMTHLARRGAVCGVEPSETARAAALRHNPGRPVLADLSQFPEQEFTAIFAIHVVEHLSDEELSGAFAAFRRALVPGGGLFLVTPDEGGLAHQLMGPHWRGYSDPTHVNLKTAQEWLRLLPAEGFDVATAGTDGLWDWPYQSAGRHWVTGPARVAAQLATGRLLGGPGQGESLVVAGTMRPHAAPPREESRWIDQGPQLPDPRNPSMRMGPA